mmetsp:Transcript_11760/g.21058  ORF Transcript_11760/g.21058 Transcript_11760/m.21058 type:complete len:201 (+) Transcript_11760:23-625(+)
MRSISSFLQPQGPCAQVARARKSSLTRALATLASRSKVSSRAWKPRPTRRSSPPGTSRIFARIALLSRLIVRNFGFPGSATTFSSSRRSVCTQASRASTVPPKALLRVTTRCTAAVAATAAAAVLVCAVAPADAAVGAAPARAMAAAAAADTCGAALEPKEALPEAPPAAVALAVPVQGGQVLPDEATWFSHLALLFPHA